MNEDERQRLTARIEDHLRRYGAETIRVGEAFAAQQGMHPTDFQALVLVMNAERQGHPATAKDLRAALGLTSGGVTAVVDRLVDAGHVRREPHPEDRRRHTLHYGEAAMAVGMAFFGPLGRRMAQVNAEYSTAELAVVERFLAEAAAAMAAHRAALDAPAPARPDGPS